MDAGIAPARLQHRHRVQGDLITRRHGHRELGEVLEAVAVAVGKPDVDLVVLRPDLDLGRVPAVERGPKLSRHRGRAESEGKRAIAKPQPNLGFSGAKIVREVPHPPIAAEPCEKLGRGGLQLHEILAHEPDIDRPPARSDLGLGELERDDVGQIAHRAPPPLQHVAEPRVAHLGPEQVDGHGSDVGPRFVGVVVAVVLDPDIAHEAPPLRLVGCILVPHRPGGPDHVLHHHFGPGERCALGKQQPRLEDVALDVGEGPELELPSGHHREGREQQGQQQPDGQVAPGDRRVHQPPDEPFGEAGEARVEPGPETPSPAPLHGPQRTHQVMRQDEERLDQAERQGEDEDDRHDLEDRPDVPAQERERPEDAHGGEERGEHPRRHLLRAGDRRVEGSEPGVAVAGDVLRDHDGVVHQQADRDEQGHHRDHVEGKAERGHPRDGAHEGDGEARRDPERVAKPEEEPHHEEHEAQSLDAVAQQHGQPVADDGGHVPGDLEGHAGRRAGPLRVDMGPQGVDDIEDVVALALLDGKERGPLPVEEGPVLLALEAVGDGCDVAEPDRGPARRPDDHEPVEVPGSPALVVEADEDRGVAGLDRADGELHTLRGHRVGEVAEAEPELAHGRGRHLDPDLVLREPSNGHLGDPGNRQQVVLHPFGIGLEALRPQRPRDRDEGHEVRAAELAHDRLLGRIGKVGDGVDLRLDVVEEAVEVPSLAHDQGGDGNSFSGFAAGLVPVVDAVRRVLDPLAYGLFDVQRGRPREGNPHFDGAGGNVGKRLALDGRCECEPDQEECHHHQVGGRRVVGEEPDHLSGLLSDR